MTKNLIKQMMKKVEDGPSFLDPEELIAKINNGYIAKREPKHTKKKTFAPSTLAWGHGECPRYWYLAFEGNIFEDNSDPYAVANMTSGTKSHDRIQQAMLDGGVAIEYLDDDNKPTTEFKVVSNDPPIFGWGDAMIPWNGEDIIGEIKTMKSEAFEHYKVKGEPAKYHLMQLIIYMKVLGKARSVLIYENKNNHDLLVFPVEINDYYKEWINNTFDWMRTVHKSWKDQQLPQKNYRSNAKVCKGCPVKAACATADIGVVKIKSLEGLSEAV